MDVWLLLIVMSLATYRLTRLVVEDDFPPVLWVRLKIAGGWVPGDMEPGTARAAAEERGELQDIDGVMHRYVRRSRWSGQFLADLVSCPWCASGWVALGVTAGVWAFVGLPVPFLVWPAVWAVGALIAGQEWA